MTICAFAKAVDLSFRVPSTIVVLKKSVII